MTEIKYKVDYHVYPYMIGACALSMVIMNYLIGQGFPDTASTIGYIYLVWGGIMLLMAIKDQNKKYVFRTSRK